MSAISWSTNVFSLGWMGSLAIAAGCGSAHPVPADTAPAPSVDRAVHTVSAVVLVNGCLHFGADNARLAEAAMNQLVDGCGRFTGERVQFTATLLPGGSIQFEPRPNDSQAIPICVLSHPLIHHVHLQKACSLDVRLEEGSLPVPRSGDAGP